MVQVGDKQILRVTGSYSFLGDDGKMYDVKYAADENGYQPMIESRFATEEQSGPISSIDPNLSKTLLFG